MNRAGLLNVDRVEGDGRCRAYSLSSEGWAAFERARDFYHSLAKLR